jgi:hypothetical protein
LACIEEEEMARIEQLGLISVPHGVIEVIVERDVEPEASATVAYGSQEANRIRYVLEHIKEQDEIHHLVRPREVAAHKMQIRARRK